MPQPTRILLVDDGELSAVARILDTLELGHTRIRGQQVVGKLAPPSELLITTSHCAKMVRRGSPPEAPSGRPIRIVGVDENSSSMRRMLRRLGCHLLVEMPGSEEIWRPLIHGATYGGEERRRDERVVIAAPVDLVSESPGADPLPATLLDLSCRGAQLLVPQEFTRENTFDLVLPRSITANRPLTLRARVKRISDRPGGGVHALMVGFDEAMKPDIRADLTGVVKLWAVGPPSGSKDRQTARDDSNSPATSPRPPGLGIRVQHVKTPPVRISVPDTRTPKRR